MRTPNSSVTEEATQSLVVKDFLDDALLHGTTGECQGPRNAADIRDLHHLDGSKRMQKCFAN